LTPFRRPSRNDALARACARREIITIRTREQPMTGPTSRPPKKLRKQYTNESYPVVILKFEDGHQIKVSKGDAKSFDAYSGERIKIIALHDPKHPDRDVLETRRADDFPDGN
jgi:hypothetical protein